MKKYDVPEDLALFMDRMIAMEQLRDRFCKSIIWGYRRAKKAATDVETFRRKFWTGFLDVYPNLTGKALSYNPTGCYVHEQIDNKKIHPTEKSG